MEAEQLASKKCCRSRIPYLLSRCFNFSRNVEMDVPELGSLLSVFRAAQSRDLMCSKASPLFLQGSGACSQTTASSAAVRAAAGWRGSVGSAARLAAEGPANGQGQGRGLFSGFRYCHQQCSQGLGQRHGAMASPGTMGRWLRRASLGSGVRPMWSRVPSAGEVGTGSVASSDTQTQAVASLVVLFG